MTVIVMMSIKSANLVVLSEELSNYEKLAHLNISQTEMRRVVLPVVYFPDREREGSFYTWFILSFTNFITTIPIKLKFSVNP